MKIILVIGIVVLALMALVSLVRGIAAFMATTKADLNHTGPGPSPMQLKQSQMMVKRIVFQGGAIAAAMLLLALAGRHG